MTALRIFKNLFEAGHESGMARFSSLVLALALSIGGFSAAADPVSELLKLDHKPTVAEVKAAIAGGADVSAFAGKGTPGLQAKILANAPAVIAAFEKAYPGATYAALGRDSSFLGDILDAFYQSVGQRGRVVRVDASGDSRTNDAALVQFLAGLGVDATQLERSPPFIMFDQTRYNSNSQSVSFLKAVYAVASKSACPESCLVNKFNFINTGAGLNQMYNQNVIGPRFDVAGFFQNIHVQSVPTGLLSVQVDSSLTYTAEYHGKFSAFYVDRDGITKTKAGAMGSDADRTRILADIYETIQTIYRPEFLEAVRLHAFLLGYEFPTGRVSDAEHVQRIRAAVAPTPEQLGERIISVIDRGVEELVAQKASATRSAAWLIERVRIFSTLGETQTILAAARAALRLSEAGIFSDQELIACVARILPDADKAGAHWDEPLRHELRTILARNSSLEKVLAPSGDRSAFQPLGLLLPGEQHIDILAEKFFASPQYSATSEAQLRELLRLLPTSSDSKRIFRLVDVSETLAKNGWNATWVEPNVLVPALARLKDLYPPIHLAMSYIELAAARPQDSVLRDRLLQNAIALAPTDRAVLTAVARIVFAHPQYLAVSEASTTTLIRDIIASNDAGLLEKLWRFGQKLPESGWNPVWVKTNLFDRVLPGLLHAQNSEGPLPILRRLAFEKNQAAVALEMTLEAFIDAAVANGSKDDFVAVFNQVESSGKLSNAWIDKHILQKVVPKLAEHLTMAEVHALFPDVFKQAREKFEYLTAGKLLLVAKVAAKNSDLAMMKTVLSSPSALALAGYNASWIKQFLSDPVEKALMQLPEAQQIQVHSSIALEGPEYTAERATSLGLLVDLAIKVDDVALMTRIIDHTPKMTGWNPAWIDARRTKLTTAVAGRVANTQLTKEAPARKSTAHPEIPTPQPLAWVNSAEPLPELMSRIKTEPPSAGIWRAILSQDRSKSELSQLLDLFVASLVAQSAEQKEMAFSSIAKVLRAHDFSFQRYNQLRSQAGLKMVSPSEAGQGGNSPRVFFCRAVF